MIYRLKIRGLSSTFPGQQYEICLKEFFICLVPVTVYR